MKKLKNVFLVNENLWMNSRNHKAIVDSCLVENVECFTDYQDVLDMLIYRGEFSNGAEPNLDDVCVVLDLDVNADYNFQFLEDFHNLPQYRRQGIYITVASSVELGDVLKDQILSYPEVIGILESPINPRKLYNKVYKYKKRSIVHMLPGMFRNMNNPFGQAS